MTINANNFGDVVHPASVLELKRMLKDDGLRLRVYRHLLQEMRSRRDAGYNIGMCHCCPEFMKAPWDDMISFRLRVLPELWIRKPRNHKEKFGGYWFDEEDVLPRERLINGAIESVEKKIAGKPVEK